jgi:hypothetical protein
MNSNRFIHLEDFKVEIVEQPSIKKALKKLREIQVLEYKTHLSPEEQIKLSEKSKWESILPSPEIPRLSTSTSSKSSKDKQKDKLKRQQRAIEIKQKLRQEAKEREIEELRLAKERELASQKEIYKCFRAKNIKELEKEWHFSLINIYNNDALRAFRQMSIKYHPDKTGNSDALQKHLGQLRDLRLPII